MRESFQQGSDNSVTKRSSSFSGNHTRKMKSTAALKAATTEILMNMESTGEISMQHIFQQLTKYETACELTEQFFPGAKTSKYILYDVERVMKQYGFTPENTLFAQSVCPDEINHAVGDITNLFAEYFGEVFHLGGLGGVPFTGKTGFSAFSNHVPDGNFIADNELNEI
jgi:hypothetical protein